MDFAAALSHRYFPVECKACKGTGQGTKEACRQAYREAIQAYKHEKAEYDKLAHHCKEARKKLSKEEIKAIQELGL